MSAPKILYAVLYRDERDGELHLFKGISPILENREELETQIAAYKRQTLEVTGKAIDLMIGRYYLLSKEVFTQ